MPSRKTLILKMLHVCTYLHGCSKRLALSKSNGVIYHDSLLPYEVHRLLHEKDKEIERKHSFKMYTECEEGNRSHFECGESSGAQQKRVPPLTLMVESGDYMNFLDFHAPTKCPTEALKVARSWLAETIRSHLSKNANLGILFD